MLSSWEVLQFISRWGLYLSISGTVGGIGSMLLLRQCATELTTKIERYIWLSSAAGFVLNLLYFWAFIGGALDASFQQSFDSEMATFLLSTPVGSFFKYGALGYGGIFILLSLSRTYPTSISLWRSYLGIISLVFLSVWIVLGFAQIGHSVSQHWLISLTLVLHILVASWWVGSLLPLIWLCKGESIANTKLALEQFGKVAATPVILLLVCGSLMAIIYMQGNSWLRFEYGQFLLVKVIIVLMLLLLAFHHKIHRVPAIKNLSTLVKMRISIYVELTVCLIIFLLTAYLSSFLGPPGH